MNNFCAYFKRHKLTFLYTFIFTCICHGLFLLSGVVGIDTAESIMTKGSNHYFVCLNMGRQGLVFLKTITGTLLINPYVVGAMSLILLWFSSIIWLYLFSYITNKDNDKVILLSAFIFISSVLHIETFYFKVQCTEFMINFCLIGISLLWTYIGITSKKIRYFIGAVLLMLVFMGTYQALTFVYIAGAEMIFLLLYLFEDKTVTIKSMFINGIKIFLCFLTGFVLNQIITKLFFSAGNVYYDDLMHWGNDSVATCLTEIVKYVGRYITGNNLYYSLLFTLIAFSIFLIYTFNLFKDKRNGKILLILVFLALLMSPCYLAVALGGNVVYRTQLVYPFLTLFIIYFAYIWLDSRKSSKYINGICNIITIFTVVIVFINTCNCFRLTYTDKMRNEEDSYIAHDIMNRIDMLQNSESSIPVFFHGSLEKELNPSCIYGESIGKSMFNQDTDVEPRGYYSSIRCIAYISQFGKTYNIVNDINVYPLLNTNAESLPEYPKEGSVALIDGVIYVNLSNN